jgi:hypothetical protein
MFTVAFIALTVAQQLGFSEAFKPTKLLNYKTCKRCGGSGKHSYCQRFKDVCFECKGKGRNLTDADQKLWNEFARHFETLRFLNPDWAKSRINWESIRLCSEKSIVQWEKRIKEFESQLVE